MNGLNLLLRIEPTREKIKFRPEEKTMKDIKAAIRSEVFHFVVDSDRRWSGMVKITKLWPTTVKRCWPLLLYI